MRLDRSGWYCCLDHGQLCSVIETWTLWREAACRVWLPGKDTAVRLPRALLRPGPEASGGTVGGITYLAAAARLASLRSFLQRAFKDDRMLLIQGLFEIAELTPEETAQLDEVLALLVDILNERPANCISCVSEPSPSRMCFPPAC